jgi:hypothetical protein
MCTMLVLNVRMNYVDLINSSLVVPRNIIHNYKHALVNKSFKVSINNIVIYIM